LVGFCFRSGQRKVAFKNVPEDLFAAFVGVYRVPLEPVEVFAKFAYVPGPCRFHVEERCARVAGKEFEAFAIFAEMIAIVDSLPLVIFPGVNIAESAGHQQNIGV